MLENKKSCTLLFFCLSLSASYVQAKDDVYSVYKDALKYDLNTSIAQKMVNASKQNKKRVRANLLPNLSFVSSYDRVRNKVNNQMSNPFALGGENIDDLEGFSYGIQLNQTVFDLSQYKQLEESEIQISINRVLLQRARQSIVLDVGVTYLETLRDKERLAYVNAYEQSVLEHLTVLRNRFDNGLISLGIFERAVTAMDTVKADKIVANIALSNSLERLFLLTGKNYNKIAQSFPKTLSEQFNANAQSLVSEAALGNFDIRVAKMQKDAALVRKDIERSRRLPSVNASLGFNNIDADNRYNYQNFELFEVDSIAFNLNVTVPIFVGGRINASSRESTYLAEASRRNYDNTVRSVNTRVKNLHVQLQNANQLLAALSKSVSSADYTVKLLKKDFENGVGDSEQVLFAQGAQLAARLTYNDSIANYYMNKIRMDFLLGKATEQTIQGVSNALSGN